MVTKQKMASTPNKAGVKKTPTVGKGKGHINAGLAAYLAKKNKK